MNALQMRRRWIKAASRGCCVFAGTSPSVADGKLYIIARKRNTSALVWCSWVCSAAVLVQAWAYAAVLT